MDNLLRNRDVTLFEDMYKSPMDIATLAKSIVEIANSNFIGTLHI